MNRPRFSPACGTVHFCSVACCLLTLLFGYPAYTKDYTEYPVHVGALLKGTWKCKDELGVATGTITLDGKVFNLDDGNCMNMGIDVTKSVCNTPLTYTVIEGEFFSFTYNSDMEQCGNKNSPPMNKAVLHMTQISPKRIVLWSGGAKVYTLSK